MKGEASGTGSGRRLWALVPILATAVLMVGSCMISVPVNAKSNVLLACVDIGDDEEAAVLTGWGPIEPDANGGNWGGYGVVGDELYGQTTRVIWFDESEDVNGRCGDIYIPFTGSARSVKFMHLDGYADDSFTVSLLGVDPDTLETVWYPVDEYVDPDPVEDQAEAWLSMIVDLTPFVDGVCDAYLGGCMFTLRFEATGDAWTLFSTYGQVAFDHIEVYGNGVPIA